MPSLLSSSQQWSGSPVNVPRSLSGAVSVCGLLASSTELWFGPYCVKYLCAAVSRQARRRAVGSLRITLSGRDELAWQAKIPRAANCQVPPQTCATLPCCPGQGMARQVTEIHKVKLSHTGGSVVWHTNIAGLDLDISGQHNPWRPRFESWPGSLLPKPSPSVFPIHFLSCHVISSIK